MSTHKHIDKICLVAALLSLILCAVFINGEALGIQAASRIMGYEDRLFDTSEVHTIDIIIDDWDAFLETAQSEEYSVCSVVIDGEAISNVGIRGKGNTSLSTVSSMDSSRYSFKIEFDQYDNTKSYHGLDKLSLNNVIQDNTYMKDYLTYQMMNEFGVAAPLCSYAYITVNGEDWGLYLAVEAVEESFLQRNYGSDYGELYKPDSMNFGGGRGNGKDFDMNDFMNQQKDSGDTSDKPENGSTQSGRPSRGGMTMPDGNANGGNGMPSFGNMPGNFGGFGGMGSSETKLQYIDDDHDSYSTIFDSAKTHITDADKDRMISSLKQLSAYENLAEVVSVDAVLRYFVVHNYVVNGDSYTGSMIHNYYLYEENGQLSMIPWDYNLAFGTFQGGNASSSVNDDIDEVLSDRPMQAWIFSDETYSQQYYALYAKLLEQVDIQGIIDNAYQLIAPYVEKDPTAFCTYEEFMAGVETLKEFCALRSESVRLQLAGSSETVDVGTLDLSDMGTMNNGMGGQGGFGGRGDFGGMDFGNLENFDNADAVNTPGDESMAFPQFGNGDVSVPEGIQLPEGIQPPGGVEMPDFNNIGSFDGMMNNGQNPSTVKTTAILLGVSVLFLVIGLLAAFKFKR